MGGHRLPETSGANFTPFAHGFDLHNFSANPHGLNLQQQMMLQAAGLGGGTCTAVALLNHARGLHSTLALQCDVLDSMVFMMRLCGRLGFELGYM